MNTHTHTGYSICYICIRSLSQWQMCIYICLVLQIFSNICAIHTVYTNDLDVWITLLCGTAACRNTYFTVFSIVKKNERRCSTRHSDSNINPPSFVSFKCLRKRDESNATGVIFFFSSPCCLLDLIQIDPRRERALGSRILPSCFLQDFQFYIVQLVIT